MSEFEPVHYQVLDELENKLKLYNINWNIESKQTLSLLKYINMQNGSLIFKDIDTKLREYKDFQNKARRILESLRLCLKANV